MSDQDQNEKRTPVDVAHLAFSYSESIREKLWYDMNEGRLITESYPDGAVRQAIEIRKGLEDALVLRAVLLELERRGYTVISPEADGE